MDLRRLDQRSHYDFSSLRYLFRLSTMIIDILGTDWRKAKGETGLKLGKAGCQLTAVNLEPRELEVAI